MRRIVRALLASVAFAAVVGASVGQAHAATPVITLKQASGRPGDKIVASIDGFASPAVTLMVCGNDARRGTGDCSVQSGIGIGLSRPGPTPAEVTIVLPPAPCPCVVRASAATGTEEARVPLEIIGAPVGPIIDPAGGRSPVVLTARITAGEDSLGGRVRAFFGGRTGRIVELTLHNTSSLQTGRLSLGAAFGKDINGAQPVPVPPVEPLGPGEVRIIRIPMTLSAPVWGRYHWDLATYGAGPVVRDQESARFLPPGLVLLIVLLVADIGWFGTRQVRRRVIPRLRQRLA